MYYTGGSCQSVRCRVYMLQYMGSYGGEANEPCPAQPISASLLVCGHKMDSLSSSIPPSPQLLQASDWSQGVSRPHLPTHSADHSQSVFCGFCRQRLDSNCKWCATAGTTWATGQIMAALTSTACISHGMTLTCLLFIITCPSCLLSHDPHMPLAYCHIIVTSLLHDLYKLLVYCCMSIMCLLLIVTTPNYPSHPHMTLIWHDCYRILS